MNYTRLILFPLLFFGSLFADPPPHQKMCQIELIKTFDEILLLMQKLIAVEHEAARWKWNHEYPLEDEQQQQVVFEHLVELAVHYGIPHEWAYEFVRAQMDAAQMVQAHDFKIWRREGREHFKETCDLVREIRPYVIELTNDLYMKIGSIYSELKRTTPPVVSPLSPRESDQFSLRVWRRAVEPFLKFNLTKEKADE